MYEKTFKTRTKKLAVAIIKEIDKLPRSLATDVIGKQLLSMTVASLKTLRARQPSNNRKS